jgi:beta-phosphoglucomutase-like phosphatase (HAD superfamily)
VADEMKLPGKPAPDTFLEAARRLEVSASQAAIVEDALSGVEAGRNGSFGLVIGVDRTGQGAALREHGADVVVDDLGDLPEEVLNQLITHAV